METPSKFSFSTQQTEIDQDAEISLGFEWFVDDTKIWLFRNDLILVT